MTTLKRLEKKMRDGFGKMTMAEGLSYFFLYVDEALRLIYEGTKKSR